LKGIVSNIDVLLKNGLDLNRRNRNNETILQHACSIRDYDSMTILVENGSDINQMDPAGETMLHHACVAGDPKLIRHLIALDGKVRIGNPFEAAFQANLPPEELRAVLRELSKGEGNANWMVLGWALHLRRPDAAAWVFAENWVPCQDWLHATSPQISTEIIDGIKACFTQAKSENNGEIMKNCIVSLAGIFGVSLPRERDSLKDTVAATYGEWKQGLAYSQIGDLLNAAQKKCEDKEDKSIYDARAYFKELDLI
jgi:hypothetical protein